MKILILGTLFQTEEEINILNKSRPGIQNQVNAFQWAIVKGLDAILDKPVDIINVLPVGAYPRQYSDIILKGKKWAHRQGANNQEIWTINIPFIKQIVRSWLCKRKINNWIDKNIYEDKLAILVLVGYLPFLKAIQNITHNVIKVLIVTDIPEYMDLNVSVSFTSKILRSIHNKIFYRALKNIDKYVILTEQMKIPLNIGGKPYVVMEGIVDDEAIKTVHEENPLDRKIIVLYTGTINLKYGINNYLLAIDLIDKKNIEFWFCGAGDAVKDVLSKCNYDNRIKYFGYLSKAELFKLQKKATLLINPRNNEGLFTKYSFPSKTLEYMLMGKPVIMYKLDGIPDEYDRYLLYISGYEPKDMANKIVEVCEMQPSERYRIGKNARQFVIRNKNCIVQAKKICNLIMDK